MPGSLHSAVIARKHVAGDVAFLDLIPQAGQFPGFAAGAHIDLHLPEGVTRQYSLWNPPAEQNIYRIAVRLDPQGRGGSAAAHKLTQGAVVKISAPRNHFALQPAGMTILIGAGIGITPLLAMAAHLQHSGQNFALHYIDRGSKAAFRDVLAQTQLAAACRFHDTQIARPAAADLLAGCGADCRVYLCGPTEFMAALRHEAENLPVPPRGIHQENFVAAPIIADGAFCVLTARDGRRHLIAAGQSIVEVLRAAGYDIATSCEQGICGACATPVLAGIPLHQDMVLTDAEHESNSVMTPCCSRSLTPELCLDL
jgi:vanillate O-demethylase ferredoxin subunit